MIPNVMYEYVLRCWSLLENAKGNGVSRCVAQQERSGEYGRHIVASTYLMF